MKFDELLSVYLGDFGRYQKRVYLLVCLPAIWCSMNVFCWTFTSAEVKHRCKLSAHDTRWDSSNYSSQNESSCVRAVTKGNQIVLEGCSEGYVWDNSIMPPSALQEWELVCERKWIKAITQSLVYTGIFFGSLILGFLADKFGRKPVILFGSLLNTVASTICIWSPNVETFAFLRLVQGFLEPAGWQIPFVIGVELVGPSDRLAAGMGIEFFFTGGLVLLGCLAYFIREWRTLQLIVSLPGLLFLSYYWLMPESPRWLLATGQKQKALSVLRKAAVVNKVEVPDEVLESLEAEKDSDSIDGVERCYGYWDLFKTANMRRKTLICCYCWTTTTLIYHAISLNPSAIGGDFYVSFILSSLVEFPALIFLVLTLNILGRKLIQTSGFFVCGLALIFTVVIPQEAGEMWIVGLVMVAKMAVTAVFSVIYLHTSEIFPTVVRGIALGLTVTCSRIGGIISPIASMYLEHDESYRDATLIAFGTLAIISALLTLNLPETAYKKLPETMEDGENFGKEISWCGMSSAGSSAADLQKEFVVDLEKEDVEAA